jgi:hypothetical protein
VDLTDVYTSFLFNLLSQSIKIRTLTMNIEKAQKAKDWPAFVKYIA